MYFFCLQVDGSITGGLTSGGPHKSQFMIFQVLRNKENMAGKLSCVLLNFETSEKGYIIIHKMHQISVLEETVQLAQSSSPTPTISWFCSQ